MSYCKQEGNWLSFPIDEIGKIHTIIGQVGKDRVIFVTEEDHNGPAAVSLPEDDEPPAGLIQPDGEINWSCPCLGGMATGPCGVEFREAFTCFHYSEADPKGSDCIGPFRQMSDCMAQYPNVYGNKDDKDEVPSEAPVEVEQSDKVSVEA
ncbi:mitochondrial intermembrane space import and assembly protein 40-B-like isoform X1 [Panulirus ornatus]|uniref:mitochondrial intermembrane space import and assembly protein 40-B-like isoform X1 n=1 Tax=Panulirus ornatus TaxID=150431 RepID=UPI003A8C3BB6